MADHGKYFSAPMVRALLSGTKTQTRRVLNPQPAAWAEAIEFGPYKGYGKARSLIQRTVDDQRQTSAGRLSIAAGDRLWVREAWRTHRDHDDIAPRDLLDHSRCSIISYEADETSFEWLGRQRAGRHMPRWASRLTLIVTDVRVQRLQDISEEDARAEGATRRPNCSGFMSRHDGWSMDWSPVGSPSRWARDGRALTEADISLGSARMAFASFINALHDPLWNQKGDGIFGANPWVVAFTFTVHHQNIDAMERAA
ncbi:hypothetical protein KHC28_00165 [Ancylobacter sonchi]|uniref:hypothetical protein n=1 Tax=Ancylobacter sonchi TaxID=1937790 RepID=UPI001BD2111D|nr:hypothetical protein [Ancylobacter sonchi]MBS7532078.1 hypothetical protein [Ancylobacter sonchi]